MRLTCPNCQAQYEVDDAAIPARGRDVQCSSCGHGWFQQAGPAQDPGSNPGPDPETSPETEPTSPPPVSPPRPPRLQDALPANPSPTIPRAQADERSEDALDPVSAQVAPKRELDPAIADILRAEAEREARQRRKEAAALVETQPEFALTDSAPGVSGMEEFDFGPSTEASPPAPAVTPAPSDTPPPPEPRRTQVARKDLLPDIEDINSSLRAGPMGSSDPTQMMTPEQAHEHRSHGRGFRLGFSVVLICATAALLVYAYAPALAARFPDFQPQLTAYVELMNALRQSVNAWLEDTIAWFTRLVADLRG